MGNCSNKCFVLGNIVADPELKYTTNGNPVCEMRIAINKTLSQDKTKKESTVFIGLTALGKQAEICSEKLKKGSPVFVEGSISMDTWVQKDTGKNITKYFILADPGKIRFLDNLGGARYSKVILSGNIVDAPKTKETKNNNTICEFRIAVNTYAGKSDEKKEKTLYIDVVTFKEQAVFCSKYLNKGSMVILDGTLEMDEWVNKDGQKQSKIYIISNNVQCPNKPKKEDGEKNESGQTSPADETPSVNSEKQDVPEDVSQENIETVPFSDTEQSDNDVPF